MSSITSLIKRSFVAFLMALLVCGAASADPPYRVGGKKWLTEGGGSIEKDIFSVQLADSGWFVFDSHVSGDCEVLDGYTMYAKLEASVFDIGVWDMKDTHTYDLSGPKYILPENFNPSAGDTYTFPPIKITDSDGDVSITYLFKITSENGGTLEVSGYVDVPFVGRCDINAANAIWREGTPKPEIPNAKSGCAVGCGAVALFAALALMRRRHV